MNTAIIFLIIIPVINFFIVFTTFIKVHGAYEKLNALEEKVREANIYANSIAAFHFYSIMGSFAALTGDKELIESWQKLSETEEKHYREMTGKNLS